MKQAVGLRTNGAFNLTQAFSLGWYETGRWPERKRAYRGQPGEDDDEDEDADE